MRPTPHCYLILAGCPHAKLRRMSTHASDHELRASRNGQDVESKRRPVDPSDAPAIAEPGEATLRPRDSEPRAEISFALMGRTDSRSGVRLAGPAHPKSALRDLEVDSNTTAWHFPKRSIAGGGRSACRLLLQRRRFWIHTSNRYLQHSGPSYTTPS